MDKDETFESDFKPAQRGPSCCCFRVARMQQRCTNGRPVARRKSTADPSLAERDHDFASGLPARPTPPLTPLTAQLHKPVSHPLQALGDLGCGGGIRETNMVPGAKSFSGNSHHMGFMQEPP